MNTHRILILMIVLALAAPLAEAQSRAGRRAKKGAAMGAVWGLLLGRDLGDVAAGAAAGAAMGGVSGAIDDSYAKKDRQRYEQQRAQAEAEAQARAIEEERRYLESERQALEQREQALAERQSQPTTQASMGTDSFTDDEWIEFIGLDNWNALVALAQCQHQRALLLAQAGATIDNPEYRLASQWLEALVALDLRDAEKAESFYPTLVELDSEVDTVQQASIEADKAILEIRDLRREEGVVCER